MNFYYQYWSDAIIGIRRHNPNKADWKTSLYFTTTICNSLNLWVVMLWLKYFDVYSFDFYVDFFPGTILNSASEFVICFASPFIFLNYFLVFYRDRYKKFVGKHPDKNGWLAFIYSMLSLLVALISFFLYDYLN